MTADPAAPGPPHVRAVVLNYNGGEHVPRCLEALLATDWPAGALEVVVVDNCSTDGSDREIEQRFPAVRLLRSPANAGFPANNLAMRDLAGVDYVALVNNDAFVTPGWLQPLVAALEADPEVGAACPRILLAYRFLDVIIEAPTFAPPAGDTRRLGVRVSGVRVGGDDRWARTQFGDGFFPVERGGTDEPTFRWAGERAVLRVPLPPAGPPPAAVEVRLAGPVGTDVKLDGGAGVVQATVGERPSMVTVPLAGEPYDIVNNAGSILIEGGYGADRGFLQPDGPIFDDATDVFAWCGAGVLLRRGYLTDAGLFDERFFMYYEDTDLAWRGRLLGWRYRYVPTSVIRHLHAATSVEGSAMFQHYVERNRLLMLLKNAPWSLAVRAVGRYVLITASYTRRDLGRPLLRGRRPDATLPRRRLRSLLGFARLAPAMVADRWSVRRRQVVTDDDLLAWMVPQP